MPSNWARAASASATVYRGWYSSPPERFALRLRHSASNSWMWPESRSIMPHSSVVALVAYTGPL